MRPKVFFLFLPGLQPKTLKPLFFLHNCLLSVYANQHLLQFVYLTDILTQIYNRKRKDLINKLHKNKQQFSPET